MRLTVLCVCGTLLAFSSLSWTIADPDEDDFFWDHGFGPCTATLRPERPCRQGQDGSTCPYLFSLPPLTVHLPMQLRELDEIMRDLQKLKDNVDELRKMCADCTVSQSERECEREGEREHEKLDEGMGRKTNERKCLNETNYNRAKDLGQEFGMDTVKAERTLGGDDDAVSDTKTTLEEKEKNKWHAERENNKGSVEEHEGEVSQKERSEKEAARDEDKQMQEKMATVDGNEKTVNVGKNNRETDTDKSGDTGGTGDSKGNQEDKSEGGKEREITDHIKSGKKTEEESDHHVWQEETEETEKKTVTDGDRDRDGRKMYEGRDAHTNREQGQHTEERKKEMEKGAKKEQNNEKPKQTESIGRAEKERTIKEGEVEQEEEEEEEEDRRRETGKGIKTEGGKTVKSVQSDSDGELASRKPTEGTDFVSISPSPHSTISLAPGHDSMDSNEAITITSSLPSRSIANVNQGTTITADGLPTQSTDLEEASGIAEQPSPDAEAGFRITTRPTTSTESTLGGPRQKITSATDRFKSTTSARLDTGIRVRVTTTTTPYQNLYTSIVPGVPDQSRWPAKKKSTKTGIKRPTGQGPKPGGKPKPDPGQVLKNPKNDRKPAPPPNKKPKGDQQKKPPKPNPTPGQKFKPDNIPKREKVPKLDQGPPPESPPTDRDLENTQISKHDQEQTPDKNHLPIQKPKSVPSDQRPTSQERPQIVNVTGSDEDPHTMQDPDPDGNVFDNGHSNSEKKPEETPYNQPDKMQESHQKSNSEEKTNPGQISPPDSKPTDTNLTNYQIPKQDQEQTPDQNQSPEPKYDGKSENPVQRPTSQQRPETVNVSGPAKDPSPGRDTDSEEIPNINQQSKSERKPEETNRPNKPDQMEKPNKKEKSEDKTNLDPMTTTDDQEPELERSETTSLPPKTNQDSSVKSVQDPTTGRERIKPPKQTPEPDKTPTKFNPKRKPGQGPKPNPKQPSPKTQPNIKPKPERTPQINQGSKTPQSGQKPNLKPKSGPEEIPEAEPERSNSKSPTDNRPSIRPTAEPGSTPDQTSTVNQDLTPVGQPRPGIIETGMETGPNENPETESMENIDEDPLIESKSVQDPAIRQTPDHEWIKPPNPDQKTPKSNPKAKPGQGIKHNQKQPGVIPGQKTKPVMKPEPERTGQKPNLKPKSISDEIPEAEPERSNPKPPTGNRPSTRPTAEPGSTPDQGSTINRNVIPVDNPEPKVSERSMETGPSENPETESMENTDEDPLTESRSVQDPTIIQTPDHERIKPPQPGQKTPKFNPKLKPDQGPKPNPKQPGVITDKKTKPNKKPTPERKPQINQGFETPQPDQTPHLKPKSVPEEIPDEEFNTYKPEPPTRFRPPTRPTAQPGSTPDQSSTINQDLTTIEKSEFDTFETTDIESTPSESPETESMEDTDENLLNESESVQEPTTGQTPDHERVNQKPKPGQGIKHIQKQPGGIPGHKTKPNTKPKPEGTPQSNQGPKKTQLNQKPYPKPKSGPKEIPGAESNKTSQPEPPTRYRPPTRPTAEPGSTPDQGSTINQDLTPAEKPQPDTIETTDIKSTPSESPERESIEKTDENLFIESESVEEPITGQTSDHGPIKPLEPGQKPPKFNPKPKPGQVNKPYPKEPGQKMKPNIKPKPEQTPKINQGLKKPQPDQKPYLKPKSGPKENPGAESDKTSQPEPPTRYRPPTRPTAQPGSTPGQRSTLNQDLTPDQDPDAGITGNTNREPRPNERPVKESMENTEENPLTESKSLLDPTSWQTPDHERTKLSKQNLNPGQKIHNVNPKLKPSQGPKLNPKHPDLGPGRKTKPNTRPKSGTPQTNKGSQTPQPEQNPYLKPKYLPDEIPEAESNKTSKPQPPTRYRPPRPTAQPGPTSDDRSLINQHLTPDQEPKPERADTTSLSPNPDENPGTESMENTGENPLIRPKLVQDPTSGQTLDEPKPERGQNIPNITPKAKPGQGPKPNPKHPDLVTGKNLKPNVKPKHEGTSQTNNRIETPQLGQKPKLKSDQILRAESNKTSELNPPSRFRPPTRPTAQPGETPDQLPTNVVQVKPRPKTKTNADPPQISGPSPDSIQNSQTDRPPVLDPVHLNPEVTHSPRDTEFSPSRAKTTPMGPKNSSGPETGPSLHPYAPSESVTMSPNSRITSDLGPQTAGQPPSIPMTTRPNKIMRGMLPSVIPRNGPGSTTPSQTPDTDSSLEAKTLHNAEKTVQRKTQTDPDKKMISVPSSRAQSTSTSGPDLRSTTPVSSGLEPLTVPESSTPSARELRVKINQVAAFFNNSLSPNGGPPHIHPEEKPEDHQGGNGPESKQPKLIPSKGNLARDCSDHLLRGETRSRVYLVTPDLRGKSFRVPCDMQLEGGGWTLLQRRQDGSVSFNRTWADYRSGFGDMDGGEFWLGNTMIHLLTRDRDMALRVELEDHDGVREYAEYAHFRVASERLRYRLTVGGYSGTAGDALRFSRSYDHNNRAFTTPDRDHDRYPSGNCGAYYSSGWWFDACMAANLNGRYYVGKYKGVRDGIFWGTWHNISTEYYPTNDRQSFRSVRMMIRPKGFAP